MTTLKVPVTEEIIALRLHGVRGKAKTQSAARATWLLSLRDQEKQRRADSAALHALVASTTDAIEALPTMIGERLDVIAQIAVELGLGVAREIVGSALEKGFVDPTEVVARCLRDCVHGSRGTELSVHLHPGDLELVQAEIAKVDDLRDQLDRVRFVADGRTQRGAVRIETESGRLEYDPREALERVSEEVRREVRP